MDSADSLRHLREGIGLILSRWHALQTAVASGWGGNESRRKYEDMAFNLLSYFSQAKVPPHFEDLENLLDETMVLSFNAEIEDGSVEQVAEQLMVMYEECLHGNYDLIEKLRKSIPQQNAISRSWWVT